MQPPLPLLSMQDKAYNYYSLHHKQWWIATGPSNWMKLNSNHVVQILCIWVKHIYQFKIVYYQLCINVNLPPPRCSSLYLHGLQRLLLRMLSQLRHVSSVWEYFRWKRKKIAGNICSWCHCAQNQNRLPAVLEKLWVAAGFFIFAARLVNVACCFLVIAVIARWPAPNKAWSLLHLAL